MPAKEIEEASEARRTKARELFDKAVNPDNPRPVQKDGWRELWQFNKTCKKNWIALGFSNREIERIKLNKPDWI